MDHSVWGRGVPQQGFLPFTAAAFGNCHHRSNRHIFLCGARRSVGMLLDCEQRVGSALCSVLIPLKFI